MFTDLNTQFCQIFICSIEISFLLLTCPDDGLIQKLIVVFHIRRCILRRSDLAGIVNRCKCCRFLFGYHNIFQCPPQCCCSITVFRDIRFHRCSASDSSLLSFFCLAIGSAPGCRSGKVRKTGWQGILNVKICGDSGTLSYRFPGCPSRGKIQGIICHPLARIHIVCQFLYSIGILLKDCFRNFRCKRNHKAGISIADPGASSEIAIASILGFFIICQSVFRLTVVDPESIRIIRFIGKLFSRISRRERFLHIPDIIFIGQTHRVFFQIFRGCLLYVLPVPCLGGMDNHVDSSVLCGTRHMPLQGIITVR